jgi:hypothetical protein
LTIFHEELAQRIKKDVLQSACIIWTTRPSFGRWQIGTQPGQNFVDERSGGFIQPSQVTNHQYWVLPCAESNITVKTGIFRGYGVAEAPPVFQAGWSD